MKDIGIADFLEVYMSGKVAVGIQDFGDLIQKMFLCG